MTETKPRNRIARSDADGYTTVHDWNGSERLSESLLEVLSAVPGISLDTGDPIYDVVDIEAMDHLFAATTSHDVSMEFQYDGCDVRVESSGEILVSPPDTGS